MARMGQLCALLRRRGRVCSVLPMHDPAAIKAHRGSAKLTRVELARVLGCDPATIYRLETGRCAPSARLADALDRWMRRATRAA